MPPIPIYSNAPITAAAKPDGITPQTATDEQLQPPTRTTAAPTTSSTSSSPPAPQPGARPIPPTQAAQPAPSAAASGGPPPPQPGQAPSVATATATAPPTAAASSIPGTSNVTAPPPQFNIPPPTMNAAATHSTHPSTTSTSSYSPPNANAGPTTLSFGAPPPPPSSSSQYAPVTASPPAAPGLSNIPQPTLPNASTSNTNLAHPSGYVQNPYAADGTAAQRERLVAAAEERRLDGDGGEGTGVGAMAGSVWGSVVAAASKVGEGLKRGEEEAWRLAGGKGR
ncbi:hypothetical protein IWZ00DRAFT_5804 [Phyllosticta capitalensis]